MDLRAQIIAPKKGKPEIASVKPTTAWAEVDAQGRLINSTGAAEPGFTLPAGSYQLEVQRRNPQHLQGNIALHVTAGESTALQVPLVPADP